MSGIEILKKIKKNKITSKIIMLTAKPLMSRLDINEKDEEEKILFKLADRVINKPFKIKSILETINHLLK